MPDDPKAGTATQDGGDAAGTQTAGTPGSDDRDAGKNGQTSEERLAELEKQLAQARKDGDEKGALLLEQKSRIEEANRLLAERGQDTSSTRGSGNPLDDRIQKLNAYIERYPDDDVAKASRDGLLAIKGVVVYTEQQQQVQRELKKIPAALRDQVEDEFSTGNYRSIAAAHEAVKGKSSGTLEAQLKERDQKIADLEKSIASLKAGHVPLGPEPVIEGLTKLADTTGEITVSRKDWDNLDRLPEATQRKYLDAYNQGRVKFKD